MSITPLSVAGRALRRPRRTPAPQPDTKRTLPRISPGAPCHNQAFCPAGAGCRMLSEVLGVPDVPGSRAPIRSEEHTSELQSRFDLVCRLLLEKKKMMEN